MRERANVKHGNLNLHAQKVRDIAVHARADIANVLDTGTINFSRRPHILEKIIMNRAGFLYAVREKNPLVVVVYREKLRLPALSRVFDSVFQVKHSQGLRKFFLRAELSPRKF